MRVYNYFTTAPWLHFLHYEILWQSICTSANLEAYLLNKLEAEWKKDGFMV